MKALGSRNELDGNKKSREYLEFVKDILDSEVFENMGKLKHHVYTTRKQHSLNVSYYNYLLCKALGLDAKSAARAGLLHDLYFYDRSNYKDVLGDRYHTFSHPKIALENAKKHFKTNEVEEDIILKHMWPFTKALPKYAETYMIVLTDKYCCLLEISSNAIKRFINRKQKNGN